MDDLTVLEQTYGNARRIVAGIDDEDLRRPTPCPEWDVEALVGHYVNAVEMSPEMLAGGRPDPSREPDLTDRVGAFDAATAANLEAWRKPGAVDTETPVLPGMRLVDLNLLDAVAHTWDLASALGVDPDIDDDVAAHVLARWQDAPLDKSREFGAFGPEVPVPADAPALDRLLGLSGRTPA